MNYLESIIDALSNLGGEAHIGIICDYIEKNNTLDYMGRNKNWRQQVSNSITTHSSDSNSFKGGEDIFYTPMYGSGVWGLRTTRENHLALDEDNIENIEKYAEGSVKAILINSYERNQSARNACLEHFKRKNGGTVKCEICDFSFKKIYGKQFEDKIHIHHVVEISTIKKEYKIDPISDLIPVCPNCHYIIHSRKPAYTPCEVKKMIVTCERDNHD